MSIKKEKKRHRAYPRENAKHRPERNVTLPQTHPLEEGRRFSNATLWKMQQNYFDKAGSLAWQENIVPSYATCNAYIAQSYARVVMGFLRDALTQREQGIVHIFDVGAGSGQFAFHFLRKLAELYKNSPVHGKVRYRYVFIDFTKSNIAFCAQHPAMKPFIEKGLLDFALLDVTQDQPIRLFQSGAVLQVGNMPGPLVLIANYLFDSIPQDLFYLRNGQLYECLPQPATHRKEMQLINTDFEYRPVDVIYYKEQHFNVVLTHYRDKLSADNTHFAFPVVGLRFLDRMIELADKGLLIISADKGITHKEQLHGRELPYMAWHGSRCFSLPVDYYLIGQYVKNKGGNQWLPTQYPKGLCVVGFLLGSDYGAETEYAFNEAVIRYSPSDFFTLKKSMERNFHNMEIPEVLSYVRLSGYDSTAFLRGLHAIKGRSARITELNEIKAVYEQVRDNHYDLGHFDLEREMAEWLG